MSTENVVTGDTVKSVFYSVDEWADAANKRGTSAKRERSDQEWAGGITFDQAVKMAKEGWTAELAEALAIAESAVTLVEKQHEVQTFLPTWDVAGADVDMGRYLSGEPENMIDFPLAEISKHGRVITLCASITYSAAVNPEVIKRRGQVLCALALILSRLGYSSELWISFGVESYGSLNGEAKVLVKGANDTLDPAKVMFAYAHPATLRMLMFGIQDGWPENFKRAMGVPGMRGAPMAPIRDLPEGTIYLPGLKTSKNIPDAHEELKRYLREIGLLTAG